jgi:hypothetical protein
MVPSNQFICHLILICLTILIVHLLYWSVQRNLIIFFGDDSIRFENIKLYNKALINFLKLKM